MNKNNYQVTLGPAQDGKDAEIVPIAAGRSAPVRIQARPGAVYTLSDRATDKAPQQIHAKRQGRDLLLQFDDHQSEGMPDLVLENFYDATPGILAGVAEDGNTYRFIPNTAQAADQVGVLTDGVWASQALGGAPYAAPAMEGAALVAVGGSALGLGGLAAAALAAGALAGAGGGGGGGAAGGSGNAGTGTPDEPPDEAVLAPFTAALRASDDTGASSTDGITRQSMPHVDGTAPQGSVVLIQLDNGAQQTVQVDETTGQWSWTPAQSLLPGRHTLTVVSVDASNKATSKVINVTVDTTALRATFSSNFADLNTEPVDRADGKLNIKESQNGVRMTITLDEAPGRDLNVNDVSLTGGTIEAGSFTKVSTTEYSLRARPALDATGSLVLSWSSAGQTLTDVAGNSLDNAASQQLSLDFDTQAPQATVAGDDAPLQVNSGQNLAIAWTSSNPAQISTIKLTLLGQEAQQTGTLSSPLTLTAAGEGLDRLLEGYYTLSTAFVDAAGNSSVDKSVLAVNRGSLPGDAWNTSNGNQQAGTADNNLWVNRQGNQSFKGNGGADTFVWLRRDLGTAGKPDTDTLSDFRLGSDGQGDKIDIKDMLGAGVLFANLSKHVQLSGIDTTGDGVADATQVAISSQGAFIGSTNVDSQAEQLIVLQGLVFSDLNSLLPNLVWEARGSPILA